MSAAEFLRFLLRWQHRGENDRQEGRAGLLAVVEQLQGLEAPAGEWESELLPSRVAGYDPRWLDELCLSGEVAWGRLTPRGDPRVRARPPAGRHHTVAVHAAGAGAARGLPWLLAAVRTGEAAVEPTAGASADVLAALRARGACFRSELATAAGRLPAEVDDGLWDLVARGIVTADAFSAVRSLLSARGRWGSRQRSAPAPRPGRARRARVGTGTGEGRWSLLPPPDTGAPDTGTTDGPTGAAARRGGVAGEDLAEAVAWQLLCRWGVVMWEVWARESFRVPWRDVMRALRRLEARGVAMGGRFVAGLSGEQYALPDAVELLGRVRRSGSDDARFEMAASDPLNLTGTVLPGPRVPSVRRRRVVYRDGVVLPAADAS